MEDKAAGGLFGNGNRIPLTGVRISVKASGAAAEIEVLQRYVNVESVPVEAVYSFPLQEAAAVCGFDVEIGGARIVGTVEEREKAFERYDKAMQAGHGAFLLDQDRPNIFTASVGNLLPKQAALVRLSYAVELDQSGDDLRLLLPTTISPRYIPKSDLQKMDPAELDHICPPTVAGGVPYGLQLHVQIEAASDIREVYSPSHHVRASVNGRTATLELGGDDVQLDRDFILQVKSAQPHQASAVVARDEGSTRAVMLSLFPDLKAFKRGPCEFVFVVDRSGSMAGESIQQARAALLLALRSMEEGDFFNVIGFGSSFSALFPESVPYDQQNLDVATEHVTALEADLGGTEILQPLEFAFAKKNGNLPRQMIVLTDGQVGNEAAVIEAARHAAANWRIFTFGIGNGVSEYLLKALSRVTSGQSEFIASNERIEPKVMKQFARMSSAFLKNVRVDWNGLQTDLLAPERTPQLFDGDRVTLYARVIGSSNANPEVALLADGPEGSLRFPVKVDLERAIESRSIPVLMARKAIQEIEDGSVKAAGSTQVQRKENAANRRVLELALRYRIMSSQTSFVAIEERVAGTQTQNAQLRRIPVALTKGWQADAGPTSLKTVMACAMLPAPAAPPRQRKSKGTGVMARLSSAVPPAAGSPGGILKHAMDAIFGGDDDNLCLREDPIPEYLDELAVLATLQNADGSFTSDDAVLAFLKVSKTDLRAWIAELGCPEKLGAKIIATLAALKIFATQFAGRASEWRMLADKAQRWLQKQKILAPKGFASLTEWYAAK